ncbi:Uncharacterised protein [Streptococcus pneumoniae]|nr:Uncharacterised protein [Streptococcus pneumoniae]
MAVSDVPVAGPDDVGHLHAQLLRGAAQHGLRGGLAGAGVPAEPVGPHPGERRLAQRPAGEQEPAGLVVHVTGEGQVQGRAAVLGAAVDRGLGLRAHRLARRGQQDHALDVVGSCDRDVRDRHPRSGDGGGAVVRGGRGRGLHASQCGRRAGPPIRCGPRHLRPISTAGRG